MKKWELRSFLLVIYIGNEKYIILQANAYVRMSTINYNNNEFSSQTHVISEGVSKSYKFGSTEYFEDMEKS